MQKRSSQINITVLFSFNFTRVRHALLNPLMPSYKHRYSSTTFAFLPRAPPLPHSFPPKKPDDRIPRGEGVQVSRWFAYRLYVTSSTGYDEPLRRERILQPLRSNPPSILFRLCSPPVLKVTSLVSEGEGLDHSCRFGFSQLTRAPSLASSRLEAQWAASLL